MKSCDKAAVFCSDSLRPLIEHAKRARRRMPAQAQILDGGYRLNGCGVSALETSRQAVDNRRIPPGLHFVTGITAFLKSNGLPPRTAGDCCSDAVYAKSFTTAHPPGRRRPLCSQGIDGACEFIALSEIEPLVGEHAYVFVRFHDRAGELEMGGLEPLTVPRWLRL